MKQELYSLWTSPHWVLSHRVHTCIAASVLKPSMLEQGKIVVFPQLKSIILPNPAHSTPPYKPAVLPPDTTEKFTCQDLHLWLTTCIKEQSCATQNKRKLFLDSLGSFQSIRLPPVIFHLLFPQIQYHLLHVLPFDLPMPMFIVSFQPSLPHGSVMY